MGRMVVSLSGMAETGTLLRIVRASADAPTQAKEDSNIAALELVFFLSNDHL